MIKFIDTRERSTVPVNIGDRIEVEEDLANMFYQINLEYGDRTGFINTEKPFLLREADNYTYYVYFKLTGENAEGFSHLMFNKNRELPMRGAKLFVDKHLDIQSINKGKAAWKEFSKVLD